MLTPKQIAEQIGVSDSLIYEWCSQGLLPHYRMGRKGKRGKVLVADTDLSAFLANCRHEAKAKVPPLKHIKLSHG